MGCCKFSPYCAKYRSEGRVCNDEYLPEKVCDSYKVHDEFIQIHGYFPKPEMKDPKRVSVTQ
jgi:hypothetical protein